MIFVEVMGPKASEHFLHVAWHWNRDGGTGSVECDVHPEVLIAVGADRNFVIVKFKGRFQVFDIGLWAVPYAEVVDDETESSVAGAVSEQARGVGALVVAVAGQVLDEADSRQAAGLREPVHAAPDFEVYEAAALQAIEHISFHDFGGDHFSADADVFVARRWLGSAEVKVRNVQCSPFLFAGYYRVNEHFNGFKWGSSRGDVVRYCKAVAAGGAADATFDGAVVVAFLLDYGIIINDVAEAIFRNIVISDGDDGGWIEETNELICFGSFHMRRSGPFFAER
jgi:hypothetical protein